jgi:hypothetical protein
MLTKKQNGLSALLFIGTYLKKCRLACRLLAGLVPRLSRRGPLGEDGILD